MATSSERIFRLNVQAAQAIRELDRVGRNTAAAARQMDRLGRETRTLNTQFRRMGEGARNMGRAVSGAFAAVGATAAISGLISDVRTATREMGEFTKVAQRLGQSPATTFRLGIAAELSGGSLDEIQDVGKDFVARAQEALAELAKGSTTGTAIEGFQFLKLDPRTVAEAETLTDQINLLAESLSDLTRQQQIFVLDELFGDAGIRALPLLENLQSGLRRAGQEFGNVTDAMLEDARKMDAELNLLERKFQVSLSNASGPILGAVEAWNDFKVTLAETVLPSLVPLIEDLSTLITKITEAGGAIDRFVARGAQIKSFIDKIASGVRSIPGVNAAVNAALDGLVKSGVITEQRAAFAKARNEVRDLENRLEAMRDAQRQAEAAFASGRGTEVQRQQYRGLTAQIDALNRQLETAKDNLSLQASALGGLGADGVRPVGDISAALDKAREGARLAGIELANTTRTLREMEAAADASGAFSATTEEITRMVEEQTRSEEAMLRARGDIEGLKELEADRREAVKQITAEVKNQAQEYLDAYRAQQDAQERYNTALRTAIDLMKELVAAQSPLANLKAIEAGRLTGGHPSAGLGTDLSPYVGQLNPELARRVAAFVDAANRAGYNIAPTSKYRTVEHQNRLHAEGITKAPGGRSLHNFGLAVDFNRVIDERLYEIARRYGLSYEGDYKGHLTLQEYGMDRQRKLALFAGGPPGSSPATPPTPPTSVPPVPPTSPVAQGGKNGQLETNQLTQQYNDLLVQLRPQLEEIHAITARLNAEHAAGNITDAERLEAGRLLAEQYIQSASTTAELNREMAELNALNESGVLSAEAFAAAQQRIREGMQQTADTTQQLQSVTQGIGDTLGNAFSGLVTALIEGKDAGKAFVTAMVNGLAQLASSLANKFIQQLFSGGLGGGTGGTGLFSGIGNFFKSIFGFAKGGQFSMPTGLAHGVYKAPHLFPLNDNGYHAFARGVGLMGEAGPEAVLPLSRGADGKLGVTADGAAQPINIVVRNDTLAAVEARRVYDSELRSEITEISVREVENQIRRGATPVARSIERAYGARRRAIK